MDESLDTNCDRCLELLRWSIGHRSISKIWPIRGIIGKMRLHLQKQPFDLSMVASSLDHLEQMIEEFMEISSPFSLEQVSVNALVESREVLWRSVEPYSNIDFRITLDPQLPSVLANRVWLRRALDNVIDNSAIAVTNNTDRRINVSTAADGRHVKIIVSDTGNGIENPTMLFQRPQHLQPGGKGRGLYIAHLIVDLWNGRLDVEAGGKTGATVAISLPLDKNL